MKIKFDGSLDYQQDAIRSIIDVFQGQEICTSNFTVYSPAYIAKQQTLDLNDIGYGNRLTLTEGTLVENVQNIQLTNGLKPSVRGQVDRDELDFTIEMETATGKTYVYLRTIMELYKEYGFSKHIIVVPSIPIKEGVYKSLQITQSHFKELYDNVDYNFFIYDSSKLNQVRDFAINPKLEIMVINIDAFRKSFENPDDESKKVNIIHRYNDKLGYKPIDLIKNTRPIVFVDEPQSSINTPLAKKAVAGLNPMMLIRYSATHKEKVNVMYKLDAVDAYEKKLVKQIEVASVEAEGASDMAYLCLLNVRNKKGSIEAQVEFDKLQNGKIKRKKQWLKQNDDLESITDREEYEGYIIQDIYTAEGNEYIDFTSKQDVLKIGEAIGAVDDKQVKTLLIRKTIEEHLDKELILNPQGIKVLSLFFIDAVKNYRQYDEDGNQANGLYAQIFEEEYKRAIQKPKYQNLFKEIKDLDVFAKDVHNGYFSIDKKGKASNNKEKYEYFKDTKGNTKADESTYNLIMKDKEKLLSFESNLRFIFSHSALREGWDNPNVFQICTLKEAGASEIKRRQEIGRGLRLCVNQDGERLYGHDVNTLTVMATESYKDFTENLQKEIEADTGIKFGVLQNHSFNNIVKAINEDDEVELLGQEHSETLFNHCLEKGYVDKNGKVQDLLRIAIKDDNVELPEQFTEDVKVKNQILEVLKKVAGKLEIKNNADKKKIKVNTKVLESPEFKALWERVKYKTVFSVDFDSDSLVKACIKAIDDGMKLVRGKLVYTKTALDITEGGVQADEENVKKSVSNLDVEVTQLPDIVGYLQNETNLTRRSIVDILLGTAKLKYFKINPQKFIEECIKIINEQMQLHIVDGISYEKIGDTAFYKQELFENQELFGYIESNLKESDKTPYEYVVYDSNVESSLIQEFENHDNISVYAKLPAWFKIDTPLGTYNPDWAIMWNDGNGEKLYFVVESKGTTGLFDLRTKETAKIKCGKAHFEAIGTEMLVVKDINGVEEYALEKQE